MKEQTLRKVLWVDVVASSATFVFATGGAVLVGEWLDVSAWVPIIFGLVLIPWVLLLVWSARRDALRRIDVRAIVVGNLGLVVAAAVLILGYPDAISTSGKWLVAVFALGGLDLGIAEWMGLRGLSQEAGAAVV